MSLERLVRTLCANPDPEANKEISPSHAPVARLTSKKRRPNEPRWIGLLTSLQGLLRVLKRCQGGFSWGFLGFSCGFILPLRVFLGFSSCTVSI